MWHEDKDSAISATGYSNDSLYAKRGLSARGERPANKLFSGELPLVDRSQLLGLGSAGHSGLFYGLGRRFRIDSIENGRTHKDGEKEGDYIHTNTEQQRLPATDCIEG